MTLGIILFSWLNLFLSPVPICKDCHQDDPYLCAANTLAINDRLCIDISEVPAFFYKDFLEAKAKEFGSNSDRFNDLIPDFKLWTQLLPHLNKDQIKNKFFESDDIALMPLVGVTLEQAQAFCAWRTTSLKAQLAKLSVSERAKFPKDFVIRLPTAAEWGRMRFLFQDKRMMKRLSKVASGNRAAFKSTKSPDMQKLTQVHDIYHNQHEPIGFFNLLDNVSEMTSEPGIAMGGSYHEGNPKSYFQQEFNYDGPQAWLGLRCVFEIID